MDYETFLRSWLLSFTQSGEEESQTRDVMAQERRRCLAANEAKPLVFSIFLILQDVKLSLALG